VSVPSSSAPETPRFASFFGNLELIIAILLGVVSIATAYASFQAALYGSKMDAAYATGNAQATEAESLYLEGNQQFVQDTQVFNQLSLLQVQITAGDALAQEQYDTLYFQGVSDEFGAAIERAAAQTAADPEYFYSPVDDEDYQNFLFSPWNDKKMESVATTAEGDTFNSFGDRLTLYTVLMSVSLFLLGISALVRQRRTQLVLVATGVVISGVAIVLTATVPFVGL
jgi:Tfp pilus assembly protein PilE